MLELMIPLDSDSRKPLYEQIYDYIRVHISDGKISYGEKLPSTRLLAKHLQVSRSTVELAYGQLFSEGYIESEPNRGYYAGDISGLYIRRRQNGPKARGIEKQGLPESGRGEKKYRITFSPDENEFDYFPYNAWRKISKELLSANDPSLLSAGEASGEEELKKAICDYLYHARGASCAPRQIVVGAGNEYLLMLLAQVLGKGKRVAMENPTYLKAYQTLSNLDCEMLALGRDLGGIRIDEIRRQNPDLVYIMPSHQFPMGTVMPMKRRLELLQWASEREGRYILEDDHDSEFRYKGKPIPSLQGSDAHGTVIYMGTFSKSISPAIRVSYMALPEPLLLDYHRKCGFYASTVPKEQQMMLAMFLRQGYFERYLNKMRGIYKAKHDLFLSLLKKEAWAHTVYGDYAGMHLLVELNEGQNAASVVKAAKEKGVRAYALEEYMIPGRSLTTREEKTLLFGYGALKEDEMKEGIACIRGIIGE